MYVIRHFSGARNCDELASNFSFKFLVTVSGACVAGFSLQESHAVAGKPRDAAVNSDRYQQPVGQKQSE